jgi:tetratricopeptide (TPR) repeat protein
MSTSILEPGEATEPCARCYRVARAILLVIAASGLLALRSEAADCRAQLERARELIAEQRLDKAQDLILASARTCPNDPQAYNLLGLAYDLQYRFAQAQQAYRAAIGLSPRTASFHDNLAVSLLRGGDSAAGVREFEKAIELDPTNETANLNLGACYLKQKRFSRAIRYFHAAHAEASTDPGVLLGMTEACFGADDTRCGRETAEKLDGLVSADARVRFSLGLVLAEYGQYQPAVKEFLQIPTPERDFATALNLGMSYSKLGKFAEARQSYEQAIRLDPASPDPYLRIGLDASATHTGEAIYWIAKAHERALERPDISYALAEELIHTRDYVRARDLLSSAMQKKPGDPQLLEAQGDLYTQEGHPQAAIDAYLRSLHSDPQRVTARLSLARRYLESGRGPEAKSQLRKVLQTEPGNPGANAELARLALEAGQQDAALQFARKTLASDPNNVTANGALAQLQLRQAQWAQAQTTLARLVKLDPDNPRFHYLLSRALTKLDRPREAESEFELSKKLETGRRE